MKEGQKITKHEYSCRGSVKKQNIKDRLQSVRGHGGLQDRDVRAREEDGEQRETDYKITGW